MYILCKAKQGRQTKNFEFRSLWDRSMAGAWGESRSDETCIKKLQTFACQTPHMKKQSIGKYTLMIEEHFDMLHCEFGAWMPYYVRGQNSLLNLA